MTDVTLRSFVARTIDSIGARHTLDRHLTPSPDCACDFDLARASRDESYALFEGFFRGDSELVSQRQGRYLPWILRAAAATGDLPIIDAGCGRGETLALCREQGVPARGIDINGEFCRVLSADGFDVVHGDALAYLESLEPGSIGGLVSNSVIEHLAPEDARRLVAAAAKALAPGGCIILETNNPESPYALGQFWLDPTHTRPYHAQTLMFWLCGFGMNDVMTQYRTPNPWRHRRLLTRAANYQEYIAVGFKPKGERDT